VNLEPTYLRYIYDGLIKGSIHPDNAAELPDGLIGMYEEAFDERTSVVDRQKLLQRFAIWALLKKEVSAAFVAEILRETEVYIQEFISTYSAWFNSPESGKYQLYHERLKVYLLQKLSEGEIHSLHEKIIERLEKAIEGQKADEFEWYGLEYLAGHLSIAAMLNGQGKKLIDLAYSQRHWQRQLKISKGYSWTKNSLQEVMAWASKYNDDEVIECGLQMVDLHHQEQNAAPQIVALVAEGEFDAALKRIEQFGGSDKEGLQRKFILYMLCLMELTLLDSKDKPYRKEAIEKLLKHLDEQLPVDHSILEWNDFFPSYTMFLMACELAALELDYLILYKRTNDWKKEWLSDIGPYNDLQFDVLLDCARGISDDWEKSRTLPDISNVLAKQGKVEEAALVMQEALTYARGISDDRNKSSALKDISTELAKQGKVEEAASAMQEAHTCARGIDDESYKSIALMNISTELAKQGKVEEALTCTRGIIDDYWKSEALSDISTELAKQGKVEEALICARGISDDYLKSSAIKEIFIELTSDMNDQSSLNSSRVDLILSLIFSIKDNSNQQNTIKFIIEEFLNRGLLDQAKHLLDYINDAKIKDSLLIEYSVKSVKNSLLKNSIMVVANIIDKSARIKSLTKISIELEFQNKIEESRLVFLEVNSIVNSMEIELERNFEWNIISLEYARIGLFNKAELYANNILNDTNIKWKNKVDTVEYLIKFKKNVKAEKLIGEIIESASHYLCNNSILSEWVDLLCKIHVNRAVLRIISAINSFSLNNQNNYFNCCTQLSLAVFFNTIKNRNRFLQSLNQALIQASEESHFKDNYQLISKIISNLLPECNYESIVNALNKIKLNDYRDKHRLYVLNHFASESNFSFQSLFLCELIMTKRNYFGEMIGIRDLSSPIIESTRYIGYMLAKGSINNPLVADGENLDRIIKELINCNQLNQAIIYTKYLKDPIRRTKAYSLLMGHELVLNNLTSRKIILEELIVNYVKSRNELQNDIFKEKRMDLIKKITLSGFWKLGFHKSFSQIIRKLKSENFSEYLLEIQFNFNFQSYQRSLEKVKTHDGFIRKDYCKFLENILENIPEDFGQQNFEFLVEELESNISQIINLQHRVERYARASTILKKHQIDYSILMFNLANKSLKEITNIKRLDESRMIIAYELLAQSEINLFIEFLNLIDQEFIIEKNFFFSDDNHKIIINLNLQKLLEKKEKYRENNFSVFLNFILNQEDLIKTHLIKLVREDNYKKAIEFVSRIPNDSRKIEYLILISNELFQKGMIKKSLQILKITYNLSLRLETIYSRNLALEEISCELANQGNLLLAETVCSEISEIGIKQICWKTIAENAIVKMGWENALKSICKLQFSESKIDYIKGFIEKIEVFECNENLILTVRAFLQGNIKSMEILLIKLALNELFFQKTSADKLERLNRTLNIQWAIDIRNQLDENLAKIKS
jgi:hypothetical protein